MRKFCFFCLRVAAVLLPAAADSLPLYSLPSRLPPQTQKHITQHMIVGAESGLYQINGSNTAVPLWTEGRVSMIQRVPAAGGEEWFFLTSRGLLYSKDLAHFEYRTEGLPSITIKEYRNKETSFTIKTRDLKDFSVHPSDPSVMATLTRDEVFLSRDGGKTWQSLGFNAQTTGTKAVCVADMPAAGGGTELVVFMSHALYGLAYIKPDDPRPQWVDLEEGFAMLPTVGMPDEIADIAAVEEQQPDGSVRTEIYLSQTFMPAIYRLNWEKKCAETLYRGEAYTSTIDGLCWTGSHLVFTEPDTVGLFNIHTKTMIGSPAEFENWKEALACVPEPIYSAYIPRNLSGFDRSLILNELWMLNTKKIIGEYKEQALNRESLYIPAGQAADAAGIERFLQIMEDNHLDSLVIDMKDDYGLLRYDAQDPAVLEKGYVSRYAVDLEELVSAFKAAGKYLIARIVVFKDKNLASYDRGQYAVWDRVLDKPWIGIRGYEEVLSEPPAAEETAASTDGSESAAAASTAAVPAGTVPSADTAAALPPAPAVPPKKVPVYYDEAWVDPYSEEVWEYNVAIARELISRGFDEIQFDYIRFPTDGLNLRSAEYRWKSSGMDMEGALTSFLAYARENIDAPIGIDIYGANGWYRSGARTGQDIEQLADYVDVICPMFYPSHFEQGFLAHEPAEERPYRILYYGSYRSAVIARNRVVIRPWLQAFYLNVSYDRAYYNKDYVQKQVFGVRDALDRGFMFWNNSGRYEDIQPPPSCLDPYTGSAPEADPLLRQPSFSGVWGASALLPRISVSEGAE